MGNSSITIDYNDQLGGLEKVLSGVKRPGDFYAAGSVQALLPRFEIEGVGTVSFPVPESQAKGIIALAELAPYGRGEETLVDTNVRRVWQIPPAKVQLSGTGWAQTLDTILTRVVQGLGCEGVPVAAELYKLLLYDKGVFFVSHRDTEKSEGMFGTLVVVLPSFHSGGELVIRHAGREVALDSRTQEVSQVGFAAFYADCEHEVKPVTEGHRVCLIYNLIFRSDATSPVKTLTAPVYEREAAEVARLLERNPLEQVHRFRVRQDRRRHLHAQIEAHHLDMTHETERVGSPHTLVCTKTRRTYRLRCEQYTRDIEAFEALAAVGPDLPGNLAVLLRRVREAIGPGK